jgi:UDP-3-O-[3-hydroxymyristoyl] glucosamine N-acyltransferase
MGVSFDHGAWSHESVVYGESVRVGFCSCVGYGTSEDGRTSLGDGVTIGAFCVIEQGADIGANVHIDHYCRISRGARIGPNTRILYRAQLFDDVLVGHSCIIAGELVDRTVIGDEVTFQGNTAHNHRDPTADWDTTEEPSPTILNGSVVGFGALVMGGVTIGPRAYVAAGEIVKCDVPSEMVLHSGRLSPLSSFRGMIKVRGR